MGSLAEVSIDEKRCTLMLKIKDGLEISTLEITFLSIAEMKE